MDGLARCMLTALCLVVLAGPRPLNAAVRVRTAEQVPPEVVQRMEAAAPETATARPAAPRRLLVYTRCLGYRHSSIPYAARAIQVLGEKTGAFSTVISADDSMFEPQALAQFDAVCMDNTTGELFLPDDQPATVERAERLRKSLAEFVAGGKGLVGIHAATDCSYKWPAYGQMLGGYFSYHPWNEEVAVKVEEPENILCDAFGGRDFRIADEIYQFKEPYSRRDLRVLLSLDTAGTDMTKEGIARTDDDFAVSWVKGYGKGRVFYFSLGHREEVFWTPSVLRHYLDGIQFALGDLPADTTPSAELAGEGWEPLFDGKDLSRWDGKPQGWHVEDGVIAWAQDADFLWSKERYGNFMLDLEFKLERGTNSGVMLRTDSRQNWLHTGIEIQLLDSYGKQKPDRHDCGAMYDCLAPTYNAVRPAGQWNRMIITCRGSTVRVALNGLSVLEADLDRWTEAHKNPDGTPNKFDIAYRDMARTGYIGLQDHGSPIWFRNIRIKTLDRPQTVAQ